MASFFNLCRLAVCFVDVLWTRQVFVACQKSIPTTAILPELELEDSIDTLKELTEQCRVDAEQAQASVAEDAIAIKKKIMDESWNQ